jgi:hypothetical protein
MRCIVSPLRVPLLPRAVDPLDVSVIAVPLLGLCLLGQLGPSSLVVFAPVQGVSAPAD